MNADPRPGFIGNFDGTDVCLMIGGIMSIVAALLLLIHGASDPNHRFGLWLGIGACFVALAFLITIIARKARQPRAVIAEVFELATCSGISEFQTDPQTSTQQGSSGITTDDSKTGLMPDHPKPSPKRDPSGDVELVLVADLSFSDQSTCPTTEVNSSSAGGKTTPCSGTETPKPAATPIDTPEPPISSSDTCYPSSNTTSPDSATALKKFFASGASGKPPSQDTKHRTTAELPVAPDGQESSKPPQAVRTSSGYGSGQGHASDLSTPVDYVGPFSLAPKPPMDKIRSSGDSSGSGTISPAPWVDLAGSNVTLVMQSEHQSESHLTDAGNQGCRSSLQDSTVGEIQSQPTASSDASRVAATQSGVTQEDKPKSQTGFEQLEDSSNSSPLIISPVLAAEATSSAASPTPEDSEILVSTAIPSQIAEPSTSKSAGTGKVVPVAKTKP